jgi:hypothetical protein
MINADIVVPISACGMIGWIAWVIFSSIRRYKVAKFQAEVQAKLLERFDSNQSLLAYVETEAGKGFLKALAVEQTTPYGRILNGVQAGIVLTVFGAALLALRGTVEDAGQALHVFGVLAIALGIGFLLAAGASYWLSRSFGSFERESR